MVIKKVGINLDEREREIRRKRRRRQMMMKRRRRQRRLLLAGISVLVLLFVVGLSACVKMCGSDDQNKDSQESQEENVLDQNHLSEDGDSQQLLDVEPKILTLAEEDIYKGDLILVNSLYEYGFEENASTIQLTSLDEYKNGVIRTGKQGLQLAERILEPLNSMISDCNEALGVDNTGVTSAYRSREYQVDVYNQYVEAGGVEYADAYVSDPGYSEHHTGLSLDMGIYYADGGEGQFSGSENAQWIDEHCQEYGFVRRYKEDKIDITGIQNESWHFRYVGIPHAVYMNENNFCLEEYIEFLRNSTSKDAPISISCNAGTYEVYAEQEKYIEEPACDYSISGDNIDGFIVTVLVSK